MKPETYEEALKRITELEAENEELKKKLAVYGSGKFSGRKKHNAKWMDIYHDFERVYATGLTLRETADRIGVSERTVYRYKAYYDSLKEKKTAEIQEEAGS